VEARYLSKLILASVVDLAELTDQFDGSEEHCMVLFGEKCLCLAQERIKKVRCLPKDPHGTQDRLIYRMKHVQGPAMLCMPFS
jgi:hypothetical protein